jgi:hypothetical protein
VLAADGPAPVVFFSIMVPDLADGYTLDVAEDSVTFKGASQSEKAKSYEFKLDLFAAVEKEEGKKVALFGKGLQVTLRKKGQLRTLELSIWFNSARQSSTRSTGPV